jgi:hypothetical protein
MLLFFNPFIVAFAEVIVFDTVKDSLKADIRQIFFQE